MLSGIMTTMSLKMNFAKVRKTLLMVFILGSVFSGGYFLGVQGFKAEVDKSLNVKIDRQTPPDKNVDFSLFWQVWDTVTDKYYDKTKLDSKQMVYGAISGMVSSLGDPFTMFLPPAQNKTVNEDLSGSFEGVGIQIGFDTSQRLMVESPLPESPAEKAGVKAGDYIVHIKDAKKNIDQDTVGINITEAVNIIRGPKGSVITLTLVRKGETKPIITDLTRAKLDVPSVALSFVGPDADIAQIKLNSFDAESPQEWRKAVDEILAKGGVKGIIVDLRNNPGGYLQDAVELAGDFVKVGTVIVTEENGQGGKFDYKTDKPGRLIGMPVVILINGGSASASEILSGALRDHVGAKLVGEKSFGKGTVQAPIDFPGGSGLHVTVAKWLTPKGTWVHEVGLTPDVMAEAPTATGDAQLDSAITLF
jgi:carboxyl-terminal processing protease